LITPRVYALLRSRPTRSPVWQLIGLRKAARKIDGLLALAEDAHYECRAFSVSAAAREDLGIGCARRTHPR